MTSTHDFLRGLVKLTAALDGNLHALGGYALSVKHYAHSPEKYHVDVQAFADTVEDGQAVADVTGITFTQNKNHRHVYGGNIEGVRFTFLLDYKGVDTSGYPERFEPRTRRPR